MRTASVTIRKPESAFSREDLERIIAFPGVVRVDALGARIDGRFNAVRVTFSSEATMNDYMAAFSSQPKPGK